MTKPDNPPAFPDPAMSGQRGMSLRDWFAGQAIERAMSLTSNSDGTWDPVSAAIAAYDMADAMLAERTKTDEQHR